MPPDPQYPTRSTIPVVPLRQHPAGEKKKIPLAKQPGQAGLRIGRWTWTLRHPQTAC